MASQSEVGHAKNLANIDKVINLATQFGITYNPTNPQITLVGLATTKTNCTTVATNLANIFVTYKNDTNLREIGYKPVDKLVTAVLDNVKTLNVPQQTIDDCAALVKKIHGDTKNLQATPALNKAIDPNNNPIPINDPTAPNTISTSQQSYDSILANLQKLVLQVQAIPSYAPNEANIQTANLTTLIANLSIANLGAITSINAYNLARNQRNLVFYAPSTGLTDIMKKVKSYTRQVYGSQSSEYHQMTAIKFVRFVVKKKTKKK